MIRISWLIWFVVIVFVGLYVCAGAVASRTEMLGITLEPGYSAQMRIFRFAEDPLRMQLLFRGDHMRRSELGTPTGRREGTLKSDNPGAAIRIVASMPGVTPVTYEAMPKSGWGSGVVFRDLTASLSIAPGVWPWPPAKNQLVLNRGTNVVNVEVVSVEPPLIGEAVELWVDPPLGFKQTMPSVAWLWSWFLWPLFFAILLLWAVALGLFTWRIRSRVP